MDKVKQIFGAIWGFISGILPTLGDIFGFITDVCVKYPLPVAALLLLAVGGAFYRRNKALSILLFGIALGAAALAIYNSRG